MSSCHVKPSTKVPCGRMILKDQAEQLEIATRCAGRGLLEPEPVTSTQAVLLALCTNTRQSSAAVQGVVQTAKILLVLDATTQQGSMKLHLRSGTTASGTDQYLICYKRSIQ